MSGAGGYRLIDQPLQIFLSNDILSLPYDLVLGLSLQANVLIQP